MKMTPRRARLIRRVSILIAAAPLFQGVGWCETAFNRTGASTLNALPSTYFAIMQNIALLPIQYILTGGFVDSNNNGGGGGI